ncbi:MAG: Hsp20/alpha crystallin family protein [Bacteroidota bacterium]
MTLMKVNPRNKSVFNHFDNLLNEFFNDGIRTHASAINGNLPFNLFETANGFQLELAVPGLTKEDIDINVDKDLLKVSAKKEVQKLEGQKVLRRNFGGYQFAKSFHLPESVDTDKITATFKDGVLTIELAKKEAAVEKPARTIEIA